MAKTEKYRVLPSPVAPSFLLHAMPTMSTNKKELKIFIRAKKKSFLICVTGIKKLLKIAFQNLRAAKTTLVCNKTVPQLNSKKFCSKELSWSLHKIVCRCVSNPNTGLRCVQWRWSWKPWSNKMLQMAVKMTCKILIRRPPFWRRRLAF